MSSERILARWREAGEWWNGSPYREVVRLVDEKGVRREEIREGKPLRAEKEALVDVPEDGREEIDLRLKKVRDEKVAKACGYAPIAPEFRIAASVSGPLAALHALSGYSFGRSSMLAEEIPPICAAKGYRAALIADAFSLTGVYEFALAAKKAGIKALIGASFETEEGGEIVLVAKDPGGYENLSQIVSACCLREPRLFPLLRKEYLDGKTEGLLCLSGGANGPIDRALTHKRFDEALRRVQEWQEAFGKENVYLQVERSYLPWEIELAPRLRELSEATGARLVAGGAIVHAERSHFPAQDVLTCVETLCGIEEVIGRKPPRAPGQPAVTQVPRRGLNAERYIRSASELVALYPGEGTLLEETGRLADRCEEWVLPGRAKLPPMFPDDAAALRQIALAGARERRKKLTPAYLRRIEHELQRIIRLEFSTHFLTAWEMCDWARERGCVFSGRGSVVDSAVAFCLGFSRIDAFDHGLHFDRFLPADGTKRPDIDIDFEANRRDEVRQHLADRYGDDRVATVAAVGAYCSRGIIREVGKAMGLPNETLGFLAKRLHGGVSPDRLESALENRPELRDSGISKERYRWVFRLAQRLMDVPRNMRAHSSGVVISDRPIARTTPVQYSGVESVKILQWDKRSAKHCFDKFDVLCLRGNDVLANAQEKIRVQNADFDVEDLPLDDPETYRAFRSGALIGIPQSASPAMRQAHIRLRTEDLTDASLVQAGIRPGVGGAVKINELIARRRGKPFSYEHPLFEKILGNTYGLIVFQEQVDLILQEFGGYSSGEAESVREAIHKRRREEFVKTLRDEIVARIVSRGFNEAVAAIAYDLVAGFQGYGFAQGHALAFAEISIRSVYCQQNYPAEYFAAILNAQPAGYYGPYTLANEARSRGVKILPPCVQRSGLEFEVEDVRAEADPQVILPNAGIRVALRQIQALSAETMERIVQGRPYENLFDFASRARPERDELERLILCGALDDFHPNRRELLWSIPSAMTYAQGARHPGSLGLTEPPPSLTLGAKDFSGPEKSVYERKLLHLDVAHHLMAYERDRVREKGGVPSATASRLTPGTKAFVVGNPIRLRFPPTASGKRVVFFDLEDESGLLNVTCFDETYQLDGYAIVCSPYVTVKGVAQDRDGHIAFLAERVFPYQPSLSGKLPEMGPLPIKTADFLVG